MSAPAVGRWLLIAAGIAIAAAVVGAVAVMGTPGMQRDVRLDAHRISNLQDIVQAIDTYYGEHARLPADLAVLGARPGVALELADPVTAEPYGLRDVAGRHYTLCARFVTDSGKTPKLRYGGREDQWAHGVGETCFKRTVDTSLTDAAAAAAAVEAAEKQAASAQHDGP